MSSESVRNVKFYNGIFQRAYEFAAKGGFFNDEFRRCVILRKYKNSAEQYAMRDKL